MPKKVAKKKMMKAGSKPVFVIQPRSVIQGNGFFDDIWSGIKSVAGPINDILKDTKAVSTIASLIPDARAQGVARVAGSLGYGKMRGKGRMKTPIIKA